MSTSNVGGTNTVYHTIIQPPPGNVVAPHGFPTDPLPSSAPKPFLDAMSIRIKVFVEEQHCALEPELDEDDPRSWSWIAYDSVTGQAVSTIRIVPPPHAAHPNGSHGDGHEEPHVKLTRVATLAHARGRGLSRQLTEEAFAWLVEHAAEQEVDGLREWKGLVLTHAQVGVEKMYARWGFVTDPKLGKWDEEGIEHVGMWRRLDVKK